MSGGAGVAVPEPQDEEHFWTMVAFLHDYFGTLP